MKFLLKNNRKFIALTFLSASVLFFSAVFWEKNIKSKEEDPIKIEIPAIPSFSFPERVCNIRDFGAIEGGDAINTKNINDAILDCAKNGGGKVVVPAGKWLTGPINLKSNINLYLNEGAEIFFSTNFSDYLPTVFTRFEGIELYNYSPLIYTKDSENVAITGKGTLNGQGKAWWNWKREGLQISGVERIYQMAQQGMPAEKRISGNLDDSMRPSFIQFINCKNILLEDFKIKDGPMWTLHPIYSENMLIRNIEIRTSKGPNTDGIAIDSSRNITVDGAYIESGDDAIAIKSGKDKDGLAVNKPAENIVIKNCEIKEGHSGIAIGSEMSGGVRNVLVENCKIDHADFGIHIKSMRGRGGTVENIFMRNLTFDKTRNELFRIDMQYGTPEDILSENLPTFKNIYFRNISCRRTTRTFFLRGLPEKSIENVSFENIKASSKKELVKENVVNDKFKNIKIRVEEKYSHPMFGN